MNYKKPSISSTLMSLKLLTKVSVPWLPGYHLAANMLKKLHSIRNHDSFIERLPAPRVSNTSIVMHNNQIKIILTNLNRCSIAKRAFWNSGALYPLQDLKALDVFMKLAKHADCILDIGCNSGLFSLSSALTNPKATIFAFDILPEAWHIFIDNMIANRIANNCCFMLLGIGEPNSSVRIPLDSVSSEMPTSLRIDNQICNGSRYCDVNVTSLDALIESLNLTIGKSPLVKIDVEGLENLIFRHSHTFTKEYRPVILCEILQKSVFVECNAFLDQHNYVKHLITEHGLERMEIVNPLQKYRDWLFVPAELNQDITTYLRNP
jgi:FkbM family methyltransferase